VIEDHFFLFSEIFGKAYKYFLKIVGFCIFGKFCNISHKKLHSQITKMKGQRLQKQESKRAEFIHHEEELDDIKGPALEIEKVHDHSANS
jgi:hypothetical protein